MSVPAKLRAMFWRALLLLFFVVGLSVALTMWLGHEVLLALGLILTQIKVIAKKIASVELPAVLAWLKVEVQSFFRVELLKKWFYSSIVPMLVGNAILRRINQFFASYLDAVRERYAAMMTWYRGLDWHEKLVATLVVVFATLALTVSSLGLWLVLFSVQLPLWFLAGVAAFGKSIFLSTRKWLFKAVAFFQLSVLWRIVRGRLPADMLERKRRLDFRIARRVVRQRRLTVQQLASGKDGIALRWAILRARWRGEEDD